MADQLKNHKGLALAHLNIRSLWKKLELLKITLSNQMNIDILGLSETWLNSQIGDNFLEIPEYNIVRCDRTWTDMNNKQPKKGGGLCLYLHKTINFSVHTYESLNRSSRDIECQWIKIFLNNQRNLIIGNIYRPPQGNVKNFIETLETTYENFDLDKNDIFLMGDYNIDFLNKNENDCKAIKEFVKQTGMKECISLPTRFSNIRNSCLDQILTNSNFISHSGTSDLNISDHQLVYVIRKKTKYVYKKLSFKGRSYRNYDKQNFQNKLSLHNWNELLNNQCPNDVWDQIVRVISGCIDPLCPLKNFKIKNTKEPWVTPELLEFIKDKDKALRKAKKSKTNADWEIARRLRNQCLNRVRNCKSNFIKEQLNENFDDSKKFWNTIKKIVPDMKNKNDKFFLIDSTTNKNITQDELPDYINNFFADIGPNLAKKITGDWTYEGVKSDIKLHDIVVSEAEIIKACNDININKASSVHNLSSRIIKDAFLCVPNVITHLIQTSITTGLFPDMWKIANIVPLQKGGDKSNVTNLRPVSLLPLPSKIIERVIHDRVMFHFERNNILEGNQGGFRKKHSTMDTIAKFTNDIFNGMNKRNITLAAFIDLAKAFDTVNHKILIQKLETLGITGNLLKLFINYLTNRKQITTIENKSSQFRDIVCGVPQGSILGPMLFLVYVNDISSVIKKCKYQLYADDTVIYLTGQTLDECTESVEPDLNRFVSWCKGNALTVNTKKSKYVTFGLKSQTRKIRNHILLMDKVRLERVASYKYLGVQLDMNLNFHKYLQDCIQRTSFKIYMLSKIRNYVDFNSAITIYKTMILPVLEYGDIAYDMADKKSLGKLQTLQNRALRICVNRNVHVPTIRLHQLCKIAKLEVRRIAHLRMFMFNQRENELIVNRRNVFTRAHDAPLFITYKPNNEKYKRNIFYNGAIHWNELSVKSRNTQKYDNFKETQKKWMLRTNVIIRN